jgi:hypothetical protein
VQHELSNNELILRDYGHLKYCRIDDPRPEPTRESDEDWQAMNCVLDNGVRILARSRGQKVRGVKHRQHRPSLIVADDATQKFNISGLDHRDPQDISWPMINGTQNSHRAAGLSDGPWCRASLRN